MILSIVIALLMLMSLYLVYKTFENKNVVYKDRIIKEECTKPLVDCSEKDGTITCNLPKGKKLEIKEYTDYNITIK